MNTKDTYYSIKKESQGSFKDKGSKFLAFAYPVTTEEEIKKYQQILRKTYYDARHHVYAWRLGIDENNFRANDDGEPANSSGMPILGQIRSYQLSDILIVVIRYFGGTKLGIPGLINAYRTSAKEAIEDNTIITKIISNTYQIAFLYENMNIIMKIIKDENLKLYNTIFELKCRLDIHIRQSESERIIKLFKKIPNIKITPLN